MKGLIDYYNECYIDYRILWRTNKNLSLHYGFHDEKHKTHDKAVINMNRVLAKTAKIKSKDRVLDAGCGIGGSSIWIAKNLEAEVTGLNVHEGQLKIARYLSKKNKVESLVKFVKGDFTDTGFPDSYFDAVFGLESICYAENKKDFLKETRRILKNNGRMVIADGFLKKENLEINEKKEMEKWLDGWYVPNLAGINEFRIYLEELGFKNIEFRDITENVMPSSVRLYRASIPAYPIGKFLELVKIRTKKQTGNIVSASYQYKTLKKGLWAYCIFYAEK